LKNKAINENEHDEENQFEFLNKDYSEEENSRHKSMAVISRNNYKNIEGHKSKHDTKGKFNLVKALFKNK